MKYKDAPEAPSRNILLYGPPKTSKTTAACSAPGPVGLLNLDLPNATWFAHRRSLPGSVMEIEYEGHATVAEMMDLAERDAFDFKTVVVDPVGELYRRLVAQLSRNAITPPLQAYQAAGVHVERLCRALCMCESVNAIFVCHDFPVKDEASGGVERLAFTGSATNPSLGNKLMAMVDVIGYTGVIAKDGEEPVYAAQLISNDGRRGGDRFNVLGAWRTLDLAEWFRLMDEAAQSRYTPGMTNKTADEAEEGRTA